jgi:predicted nucleic acid-binding protein
MRYLLDTNVVSDLVRRPQGPVAERIRQTGEASVCMGVHANRGTARGELAEMNRVPSPAHGRLLDG